MRYVIDRSFNLSTPWSSFFIFLAVLFAGVITIINFIAVGYEDVTILSSEFNASNPLWYDAFIPSSQRSRHRNCTSAMISLDDRIFSCDDSLIKA